MSALHVVMWMWTQSGFRCPYLPEHVNAMAAGLRRGMAGSPYRPVLVTDAGDKGIDPSVDVRPLWGDFSGLSNASGIHLPSCYRRLKLFDPATQADLGIAPGDRVCSIDLDAVVAGDMRPLLSRQEKFVGWAVRGTRHPKVYNGSMWLFTAGDLTEMWAGFDPARSPALANKAGFMGSDQSWLSYRLARAPGCAGWAYPQVASYPKELRVRRQGPPPSNGVVFFHGKDKPWHDRTQRESPWVKRLWGQ